MGIPASAARRSSDGLLRGKQFLCDSRFTLADIILFSALDFGRAFGQPFDHKLTHLGAWFARVAERPSAQAG